MKTKKTKKMYHVEKFLPPECPKCQKPFLKESEDWLLFLGDIVDGVDGVTSGHNIIICTGCDNWTARYPLEFYQLSSKAKAKALLKEGFVNLKEVIASGNMTQDSHIFVANKPGIEVKAVVCDPDTPK